MPTLPDFENPWEPGEGGFWIYEKPVPLPGQRDDPHIVGVMSLRQINDLLYSGRPYLAEREFKRLDFYHPHLRSLPQYIDLKMRIQATIEQDQTIWKNYLEENPDALKQEMAT
jgi:hypothetical protein